MTRRLQKPEHHAAEADIVTIVHVDVRERGAGSCPQVDFRAGAIGQLAMPADEVGVEMRFNDVLDGQTLLAGFVDVQGNVALRIDDAGNSL